MNIKNEAQRTRTCKRWLDLIEEAEKLEGASADTVREVAQDLFNQVKEYDDVRSGATSHFELDSIDDIAGALIKARVRRGLTQKALAEELGVSEQQIQKWERGGYERASLARIADVADVLEYELDGFLRPSEPQSRFNIVANTQVVSWSPSSSQGTTFAPAPVPNTVVELIGG